MAKLNFSIALGLAANNFKQGLNGVQNQLRGFASSVKSIMGMVAGAFAAGQIKAFSQECLQAYQHQLEAEQKLSVVMKQRMNASDAEIDSIKKLTAEQQKLGIIGDEVQLAGAQQVATFLKQKDSLNQLIPAMNNLLAQQKGVNATQGDAVNIGNLMGKVMMGQTSALKRVGISFDEAQEKVLKYGNESQKAAMLAKVIRDNVGDMNAEMAKTDIGKIAQMNNTLGDLKEKIGAAIAPIVSELAPSITEFATSMAEHLTTAIGYIKENFRDIAQFILSVFAAIKLTPMLQGWIASVQANSQKVIATAQAAATKRQAIEQSLLVTKQKIALQEATLAEATGAKKLAIEQKLNTIKATLKQKELALEKAIEAEKVAVAEASAMQTAGFFKKASIMMATSMKAAGVAIKSALLSTGIGVLVVVIGELIAQIYNWVTANNEAKKSSDEATRAIERQKKAAEKVGEAVGGAIAKFKLLQQEWQNLKTSDQTKWIKDHASAFDELGVSIKNAADAQRVFVEYANLVTQALEAQAEAQAFSELYTEAKKNSEKYKKEHTHGGKTYYDFKEVTKDNITFEEARRHGALATVRNTVTGKDQYYIDKTKVNDDLLSKIRQDRLNASYNAVHGDESYYLGKLQEAQRKSAEAQAQLRNVGIRKSEGTSNTVTTTDTTKKTKEKTPAEKAAESVANAEKTYEQTINNASTRLKNNVDTREQYEKNVLNALNSLFDSYVNADFSAPNEKYKKKITDIADLLVKQSDKVKELSDEEEKAKKAQREETDAKKKLARIEDEYAKRLKKINRQQKKGRDTTFDYQKSSGDRIKADLEFNLDIAKQQLEALQQKADDLGEETIDGLAEAINNVTSLEDQLKLYEVQKDIKRLKKELSKGWENLALGGWDAIEGSVNNIQGMIDTLNSVDASGWQKMCAVIDTAIGLFRTVVTVMELVNTVKTASAAVSTATVAAEKLETVAILKKAAALVYAAHAAIPFVGVGTATGMIGTMAATIEGLNVAALSTGGIVEGSSPIGDFIHGGGARVNTHEMVLNTSQQNRLFRLANAGSVAAGGTQKLEFKMKNRTLVAAVGNESGILSKSGKRSNIQ